MDLTICKHIDAPEVRLYGFSDWHIGSQDCDEELIKRDIMAVANDPHARCILMGDILQCDYKHSKGDIYYQKHPPSAQKKLAKEWLAPIRDKILSIQGGNHDEGRSEEDSQPIADIAEWLGVPYCMGETLLKIPVGRRKNNDKPFVYLFFGVHGWSNGRLWGSKVINLDRLKDLVPTADLFGLGHTHSQHAHKDTVYIPDLHNNNVIEKTRHFVNFGSYQKRGQYPTRKALPGQALGTPMIRLSGTKKKITVEI